MNGRQRFLRDTRGLSTVEYVIVLIVVALVGVAAWRAFGASAQERAAQASGEMSALGSAVDGPGGSGAGGGSAGRPQRRSQLEEATGDAAPPPEPQDRFSGPVLLLAAAALLVLAMVARRMFSKDKGPPAPGG